MSEALGEARIIIRPDTTLFRTQLEEQLAALRRPVVIPVTTTATGVRGGAAAVNAQAAATDRLTSSQRLQAQASEQVAAAQRANVLATQGVITQQDRAALATKAAATADRNLQTALLTEDEALIGAAAATANLAREQAALAGSAAAAARTQQQVTKGAFSATASQFGLRGATLAASVGFIAAAVGVTALSKALKASHDAADQLEVQTQALNATLGQIQAGQFDRFAKGIAQSLDVSRIEADKAGAAFSGLLVNFGKTRKEAQQTSEELVKTAANLAAFTGRPFEEASTAIQRGLAGNGRGLRAFRVFLDQSRVAEEALRETGKQHASALTRQELVQARLNIIQGDSAVAANAVAEQQGTLIGQSRTLSANFSNLATIIGGPLNRALFFEVRGLNDLFIAGGKLKNFLDPGIQNIKNFLNIGPNPLHGLIFGVQQAKAAADNFAPSLKSVDFVIAHLSDSTGQLSLNLLKTSSAMKDLTHQSDVLDQQLLKLQTTGGTPAQIIANRQADIAAQNAAIARAQAQGGAKGSATDIKKAREKIKADQAEIAAQQSAIASDQQKAASAAKAAATKAKAARDAADQALLDLFGAQQTKITDALISAGPRAAIALTIRLRNLFRRQRDEARKQIKDLKTRRDTLAADTTEIKTLNKQIRDLQKAQRDAISQQAQTAADARLTHLEALLSIAETTTGTGDDRRALERIIRFDEQRIAALRRLRHRTREQNAELDALRVDLAQREQALRALTTQQKKNQTAAAEFNFLQTQTGFVQNLLGNLIPGGATGGLVGGGGSPTVPSNVRPGDALSMAQRTSQANLVRGVTSGQAETQTNVLRRILAELHRLNQGRDHPEAHHQRSVGAAIMDLEHDTPGM